MDTFAHWFASYWWLIFVFFWPIMGIFGAWNHFHHRTEMLKMLKSYADQGKDPPPALLDAIKSDEQRAYEYGDRYYRRGWRRHRGGWGGFVAFAAMAAAFGYVGYYGHMGEGGTVFTALSIGFGIGAAAMLIRALFETFSRPRFDPRDYEDK